MQLIPEARQAHRLWSVRFAALAAGLGALEGVLPAIQPMVPDGLFGVLAALAAAGAAVSRVIKQQGLSR